MPETEDDRIRKLAVDLALSKELLRKALWLLNSVPRFNDGLYDSYELASNISAYLRSSK